VSNPFRAVLVVVTLAVLSVAARAQVVVTVDFDDVTPGSLAGTHYSPLGINFAANSGLIVPGLGFGDPGNWGAHGSKGSHFLGFNGGSYAATITTNFPVAKFSIDVSRTNGSSAADTFTVAAFAGPTLVDSETILLASINSWETLTVTGPGITRVELSGAGSGFHPFGVDKLVFEAVPEPSTYMLGLAGGALLLLSRRWRRG
jgi:hypothetical protein